MQGALINITVYLCKKESHTKETKKRGKKERGEERKWKKKEIEINVKFLCTPGELEV